MRLFPERRWWIRHGVIAAEDETALMVLVAARYMDPPVMIDIPARMSGSARLDFSVVARHRRQLDELVEDLEAGSVHVEWMPLRRTDPELQRRLHPERLARALSDLAAADADAKRGRTSGPGLDRALLDMGHAAAAVQPPTPASSRVRESLAAAYGRTSGASAPF